MKTSNYRTLGVQSAVNSPPAPCLDFILISSAISLENLVVRFRPKSDPHTFGSLLEGSPFVPELPNLVQKDPDFASKGLREIIDISASDGSINGEAG